MHIIDTVLDSMFAIAESWNHSAATDIDDRVKDQLQQKKLMYESHSILTYTISDTQQTSQYVQINTRSTGKRSAAGKYYYCAEPYRYKRSAFDRIRHLHIHIRHLHNKPSTHSCTTCLKQFSALHDLKKHVRYCDAQWNDEIDDAAQNSNIDDVIDSSITVDSNILPASNTARYVGYIDRLIRVEQLQLLHFKPSRDKNNVPCLKEYVPTQCDAKHTDCHILRHGTPVRICYDVCEPRYQSIGVQLTIPH